MILALSLYFLLMSNLCNILCSSNSGVIFTLCGDKLTTKHKIRLIFVNNYKLTVMPFGNGHGDFLFLDVFVSFVVVFSFSRFQFVHPFVQPLSFQSTRLNAVVSEQSIH